MSLSGKKIPSERAAALREQYRSSLFDDVVPWWNETLLDREHGGYFSLLERDGRRWGDDKYMWMNGRQVWMLSHLYNTHEQNPEWLEAARIGADFMLKHAFKDDGKMHFRLTREGQSRSEVLSVYTEVFGGLRYITNSDWTPTHSLEADLKLWWPHGETLYSLLLAWNLSGRDDLAQWYEKVSEYTFSHFPDPKHGEWFGYLNRDGSRVWTAKANGWKGFFHLPRILYRCYQLLLKSSN